MRIGNTKKGMCLMWFVYRKNFYYEWLFIGKTIMMIMNDYS